jgi:hypothetical protein
MSNAKANANAIKSGDGSGSGDQDGDGAQGNNKSVASIVSPPPPADVSVPPPPALPAPPAASAAKRTCAKVREDKDCDPDVYQPYKEEGLEMFKQSIMNAIVRKNKADQASRQNITGKKETPEEKTTRIQTDLIKHEQEIRGILKNIAYQKQALSTYTVYKAAADAWDSMWSKTGWGSKKEGSRGGRKTRRRNNRTRNFKKKRRSTRKSH